MGQIALEVERIAGGRVPTVCVPHAGGTVHKPEQILEAILKVSARARNGAPALAEVAP
jgi:2-oxoglutarate ferredoxin oxidoreductase subunit alpha